jgi:molybdopterin-guanine dinucleotide biosynthesis protein B
VADCRQTPAVAFVGRSGSGKTTLLVQVVSALVSRGVRVAAIKHSPVHAVRSDSDGTDSQRLWAAGADHVTLVAMDRVVHTVRHALEPDLATLIAGVGDVDLILLEGYKRSAVDKVEVIRAAFDPEPLEDLSGRIAYATNVALNHPGLPVFGLGEFEAIADFLVRRYLGR